MALSVGSCRADFGRILAGRYDVLASANDMATAAQRIDGATYTELPGSHFIQMEHPDLVHSELRQLLSRIPNPN